MVTPKLESHYSVLALISGVAFCVGGGLALCFLAGVIARQSWLNSALYACAAVAFGVALIYSYRLLTSKGHVVVSLDATGFKDTRLARTVIPWSAIRSVSPYILYKATSSTGVALTIDPAFRRGFSMRLGARLFNWTNLKFGSVVYVDTRTLDADSDEVSRVAASYLSTRT